MKFVAISDTHGKHRSLSIPEGDTIIHAGDFCHYGSKDQVLDFIEWFDKLNFRHKILIAGNHDFIAEEHTDEFLELLPANVQYLNDSGTRINGIDIWGSPVQPDLIRWAFGKPRGEAMEYHWRLIPDTTQLLITHNSALWHIGQNRIGQFHRLRKIIRTIGNFKT